MKPVPTVILIRKPNGDIFVAADHRAAETFLRESRTADCTLKAVPLIDYDLNVARSRDALKRAEAANLELRKLLGEDEHGYTIASVLEASIGAFRASGDWQWEARAAAWLHRLERAGWGK